MHFYYLLGSIYLLIGVLSAKKAHPAYGNRMDARGCTTARSVLLRAGSLLRAAGFLGAACLLFGTFRLLGAACLLFGAFRLLGAALLLGAFCLFRAALLHAGRGGSGSGSRVLGIDHSAAECYGKQSKSKFLHFASPFYGLVMWIIQEPSGSLNQYNTY